MNEFIPVYRADGSLYARLNETQLDRLASAGLVAHVVRHRKGHINRAVLHLRAGEPRPLSAATYLGTRYSSKEKLDHGYTWVLRHLDRERFPNALMSLRGRM